MWSNVAESFNSWISQERHLPIYQLVDGIRVKQMEMNSERLRAAQDWTTFLCPKMEERLIQAEEAGRQWEISRSGPSVFEVHSSDFVMVNLEGRFCSCFQWQLKGFPCEHVVAAIIKNDENPFDYIEDIFTAENYKQSYSFPIHPIPNIERPDIDVVKDFFLLPPLTKKQPGRPKVRRIKSLGEQSRPIRCGRCHRVGSHNSRTCKFQI